MDMPPLFLWLDPYLIQCFRLTDLAAVNFCIGTAALAILALLLGKLSVALVLAAGRNYSLRQTGEAQKYQELSIQALQAGNRSAYEAANKLANEFFGKSFYLGVAQSAALFWPIGLVLAWMQYRFLGVAFPIPVIGWSMGYIGIFIPLYIAAWWLFKFVKRFVSSLFSQSFSQALHPVNLQDLRNQAHPKSSGNPSE
jgi:hypothetical protein